MTVRQWFRLCGVVSVLVLAVACGRDDEREVEVAPPAADLTMADDDAVDGDYARARDGYIAAWNGSDVEAVARHFTEDATAQVGDSTYNGLAEIRRGWLQENVPVVSNLRADDERTTARGDEIVAEGMYSATIAPPDTASFQQTGRYTITWVRAPGADLRIRSTSVTPDAPQP